MNKLLGRPSPTQECSIWVDCPEEDDREMLDPTDPLRRLLRELVERARLLKREERKAPTTCIGVLVFLLVLM